jgi:hypothetical protein
MERKILDLNIYGRKYRVLKYENKWQVLIGGSDGKFRPSDIIIPFSVSEHNIKRYLEDLLHEYEPFS